MAYKKVLLTFFRIALSSADIHAIKNNCRQMEASKYYNYTICCIQKKKKKIILIISRSRDVLNTSRGHVLLRENHADRTRMPVCRAGSAKLGIYAKHPQNSG